LRRPAGGIRRPSSPKRPQEHRRLQRCRLKTVVVTKETFHVSQKRGRWGERHREKLRAPTVAQEPKFSSPISLRRVPLLLRPNWVMWTMLSASPWNLPTTRRWTPHSSSHRCFWEHRPSGQQRRHPDGGTARPVRVRQVEAATADPFGRRILDHPRRAVPDESPRQRRQHHLHGFGAIQALES
jgi:hypothetical protein